MTIWKEENNPFLQLVFSSIITFTGCLFIYLTCNKINLNGNYTSAFILGLLLSIIGIAGIIFTGKQTTVIDPYRKVISISDTSLLGNKIEIIKFDEIIDTEIGFIGKRSNYIMLYYIILKRRNKKDYPLFPPGRYYSGCSNKNNIEIKQKQLNVILTKHAFKE